MTYRPTDYELEELDDEEIDDRDEAALVDAIHDRTYIDD